MSKVRALTGKPHGGTIVEATDRNLIFYVSSTGNDSNTGLSSGTALLTVQAALDKIPKIINHTVTVNIGSGSFAGFDVASFQIRRYTGKLTLQGTLGQPTLTTGTCTGTATGGSTSQLIDTGQTWTVHELRGRLLKVGTEYRIAQDNDATTIDVIGVYGSSTSGKVYEILEQKTKIDSGYGGASTHRVTVHSCSFRSSQCEFNDIWFDGTGKTSSLWIGYQFVGIPSLNRIKFTNSLYGLSIQECSGDLRASELYIENVTTIGVLIQRLYGISAFTSTYFRNIYIYGGCSDQAFLAVMVEFNMCIGYLVIDNITGMGVQYILGSYVNFEYLEVLDGTQGVVIDKIREVDFDGSLTIKNCSSHGMEIYGVPWCDLDACDISSNGGYGIYIDENAVGGRIAGSFANFEGTLVISSNTLGGIIAKNHSLVALSSASGSSNGSYGLQLQFGSAATITSATSITGSSGDATINDGTTVLTWASDFASNLDKAVNMDNHCLIERRDA